MSAEACRRPCREAPRPQFAGLLNILSREDARVFRRSAMLRDAVCAFGRQPTPMSIRHRSIAIAILGRLRTSAMYDVKRRDSSRYAASTMQRAMMLLPFDTPPGDATRGVDACR